MGLFFKRKIEIKEEEKKALLTLVNETMLAVSRSKALPKNSELQKVYQHIHKSLIVTYVEKESWEKDLKIIATQAKAGSTSVASQLIDKLYENVCGVKPFEVADLGEDITKEMEIELSQAALQDKADKIEAELMTRTRQMELALDRNNEREYNKNASVVKDLEAEIKSLNKRIQLASNKSSILGFEKIAQAERAERDAYASDIDTIDVEGILESNAEFSKLAEESDSVVSQLQHSINDTVGGETPFEVAKRKRAEERAEYKSANPESKEGEWT